MAFYFDVNDFRLFVNIVESGSLTRGAERTFLSLPAASQRLKNFEETLGLKLLIRSAQGLQLTEPGKVYLEYARRVLAQLELLTCALQDFGAGIKGKLRLLGNTTAVTEFLPAVLGSYLREHPDVQMELRERTSDDIVRAVREGAADIGIVSGSVLMDKLQTLPLTSSRIVVIAPLGHPIVEHEQVYFKEVLDYEQVCLPEGSAIHEFMLQHALALHRPMAVRVQVSSYDAMWRMVEAGVGIAVVPITAVNRPEVAGRVGVCEMLDLWARREFFIVARDFQVLPRYAAEFVEALRQHFDTQIKPTGS
ncbi:LysR family transcriptional regulator [Cupriavidus basilensis]|uniref:LysR family transcriptional regulator n=1 Tax=Cupriavidus basilensis TaxID=68895 RepID=UPI0023E7D41B|nr:LysR family transcriptional regulator [Cupriavidus basilensis]MDF3887553.1 LysR family transcriptional regulator [Cupriavidus basilensis]